MYEKYLELKETIILILINHLLHITKIFYLVEISVKSPKRIVINKINKMKNTLDSREYVGLVMDI